MILSECSLSCSFIVIGAMVPLLDFDSLSEPALVCKFILTDLVFEYGFKQL